MTNSEFKLLRPRKSPCGTIEIMFDDKSLNGKLLPISTKIRIMNRYCSDVKPLNESFASDVIEFACKSLKISMSRRGKSKSAMNCFR